GAVWGGNTSVSAKARGLAGMVVDGAVRDASQIIELNWPVWAVGFNPRPPGKEAFGAINVPISCGGVQVQPGDIVVADLDGVVIVPLAMAEDVARAAKERWERDEAQAKRLEQGELALHIAGHDRTIERMGVREIDGRWLGAPLTL
ncbi:MAG TPA: hypothetical protein VKU60_03400, partial [Chloroflexota bacterium]|nr:hypothetical protein [Chloroflexota bacterium]